MIANINACNTPWILRERSAGIDSFAIVDEMLEDREVEFVGTIDADAVNSVIRQPRYLQKADDNGEVTINADALAKMVGGYR